MFSHQSRLFFGETYIVYFSDGNGSDDNDKDDKIDIEANQREKEMTASVRTHTSIQYLTPSPEEAHT